MGATITRRWDTFARKSCGFGSTRDLAGLIGQNPPCYLSDDFRRHVVDFDMIHLGHGGKPNEHVPYPASAQLARDNRQFVVRAVGWAAQRGIRQFLDLGAGLPTRPSVHETARETFSDARVCYVDHDPVAVLHANALLAKPEGISAIAADLTDPDAVLSSAQVLEVIDLSQPVCVLLAAVFHFYDAAQAGEIAAAYAGKIASGSVMAISCMHNQDAELWESSRSSYTAANLRNHSVDEVRSFFAELDLVPPGLVAARAWRGGMTEAMGRVADPAYMLAGVGVRR